MRADPCYHRSVDASVLLHDSFDARAWQEVSRGSARIARLTESGARLLPHFDALLFDLFAALFKLNAVLGPESATPESARLARRLVQGLLAAPGFQRLRETTALDEFRAAMGAAAIAEQLLRDLRGGDLLDPEDLALQRALAEREEEARWLREELATLRELGEEESLSGRDLAREIDLVGDELSELAEKNREVVEQIPPALESSLEIEAERLPRAIDRAEEELEAWGTGVGAPGRLSPAERLELGERLAQNPNLQKLARLVGTMRHFALAERRRRFERAVSEIHSLGATGELGRLLPSELVHLRDPLRRLDFLRRRTEGTLLAYDLRAEERKGRGPIVVCLDGSSSMAGDKELWSKAVALTLLEIARREGRAFRAISFSSREAPLRSFDCLPRARRGKRTLGRLSVAFPEVVALCEYFPGGGTDFERPLEAALVALGEAPFAGGDVVLITDGECAVSPAFREHFLAEKRRLEARLFAVEVDVGSHSSTSLRELADHQTTVTRLTGEPLGHLFREV
jgi:uncharacterized protein with von Willebrand factor type A (vWA) domain